MLDANAGIHQDRCFTVGICSFNESSNIENCIRSIFNQKFDDLELKEVIVVSSGSTDGTDEIVKNLQHEFSNLRLKVENNRRGKNSAVNTFLTMKQTELVALVNGDNILKGQYSLQRLVEPLLDESVGITGGHPIAMNSTKSLAGFASNLIWVYHHHIALHCVKIGELIAFRDVGIELPLGTQSDEDYIRKQVEAVGLRAIYAPEAETMIMGPETVKDLIRQRGRVNIGQSYMIKREQYYNPSRDPRVLMSVFSDVVKDVGFHPIKIILSVIIESLCRLSGGSYVRAGRDDIQMWDPIKTTKKIKPPQ